MILSKNFTSLHRFPLVVLEVEGLLLDPTKFIDATCAVLGLLIPSNCFFPASPTDQRVSLALGHIAPDKGAEEKAKSSGVVADRPLVGAAASSRSAELWVRLSRIDSH